MNYNITYKGDISLSNKVIVSDPCYALDTWCTGQLNNVLPGRYKCYRTQADCGEWGQRIVAIEVVHEDYADCLLMYTEESFTVGVDSGEAGIWDADYYAQYHSSGDEENEMQKEWYDRVFGYTYVSVPNPEYREFIPNRTKSASENYEKLNEYLRSPESREIIHMFDANTIDDKGFVASSGYGDGCYICCTAGDKNEDYIVGIKIVFIDEDEDMEDEE